MENKWYVEINGNPSGPYTGTQLKNAAANGKIVPNTLVKRVGDEDWHQARNVKGLIPIESKLPSKDIGEWLESEPSEQSEEVDSREAMAWQDAFAPLESSYDQPKRLSSIGPTEDAISAVETSPRAEVSKPAVDTSPVQTWAEPKPSGQIKEASNDQPEMLSSNGQPIKVKVVDFEMGFSSMAFFMIKWALAAIPAAIILGAILGAIIVFGFVVLQILMGLPAEATVPVVLFVLFLVLAGLVVAAWAISNKKRN